MVLFLAFMSIKLLLRAGDIYSPSRQTEVRYYLLPLRRLREHTTAPFTDIQVLKNGEFLFSLFSRLSYVTFPMWKSLYVAWV